MTQHEINQAIIHMICAGLNGRQILEQIQQELQLSESEAEELLQYNHYGIL